MFLSILLVITIGSCTIPRSVYAQTRNSVLQENAHWRTNYYDSLLPYFAKYNQDCSSSSASSAQRLRIALVNPTFTAAAYHYAFYDFYDKYTPQIYQNESITSDLSLLTSKIPDDTTGTNANRFIEVFPPLIHSLLPDAIICIINDTDVNSGLLFSQNNTALNAYDIVLAFHEEYVTPAMYYYFKQYVANGGILLGMAGNLFYAEVKYDSRNQTVTLVNGHGMEFDGRKVWKGLPERWENETREWFGSNYYRFAAPQYGFVLYNNVFNASTSEADYVSNPRAKILLDYNSSDTRYHIATYELPYVKGKVIGTGIWTETFMQNRLFEPFFDDLLLNHALPDSFRTETTNVPAFVAPVNNPDTSCSPLPTYQTTTLDNHTHLLLPRGGGSNNFHICRIQYNGTSGFPVYRISGESKNKTVGFVVNGLDYKGKNFYFALGDVFKYGNFVGRGDETNVNFDFTIRGQHGTYVLHVFNGGFYYFGKWGENNIYYEKLTAHSSVAMNLDDLLRSKGDTFDRITSFEMSVPPNTVLNPLEFATSLDRAASYQTPEFSQFGALELAVSIVAITIAMKVLTRIREIPRP